MDVLAKVDDSDFDVFALDKAMNGGGSLFVLSYTLLYKYGIVQHFNINEQTLVNFLQVFFPLFLYFLVRGRRPALTNKHSTEKRPSSVPR